MVQAAITNTADLQADQTETRGYVLSEDQDQALKDIALGLEAVAMLCEDERRGDMPEIPAEYWAGLLRTFARQTHAIQSAVPFANRAVVQPRKLH